MKNVTLKFDDGNIIKSRINATEETILKYYKGFKNITPDFRTGKEHIATVIEIVITDEVVGNELKCQRCCGSGQVPCGPWRVHNLLSSPTTMGECFECRGTGLAKVLRHIF